MHIKLFVPIYTIISLFFSSLHAQVYENHFGAGQNVGVTVSSSSEDGTNTNVNTLSGTGYVLDLEGASRFLGQASLGASYEEIEYVAQIGVNQWLEEQFAMPHVSYTSEYQTLYNNISALIQQQYPGEVINQERIYTNFIFYDKVLKDNDVLRSKSAFSLSQILVLSTLNSGLDDRGDAGANYYDILYEGAFGNYRDILEDVSLHLAMGYYLSHFKNEKANPALGTLPDENYAREIMQLFTIGLYEMNNDGSYKTDGNGALIPTYDITDIQELAKVFTGLSGGAFDLDAYPELAGQTPSFNSPVNFFDPTEPMAMWEDYHEQGSKVMIDGTTLPSGQTGMQDINDALDILFNHPNVGPFLAIRLIQQMVKSNPTPAYINRVASAFNNNGDGIRGDMEAVFRAILTDPEARDCSWIDHPKAGKLKQPLERFTNLFRAFDIDSPSGNLLLNDIILVNYFEQAFLSAPSVFNYFSPFYAEETVVKANDMVSPEFQILHDVTAIHYLNTMENAIMAYPFPNQTAVNNNTPRLTTNNADVPSLDLSDEIAILESDGIDALLDRLDIVLCQGQLSDNTKMIINNMLSQIINANGVTSSFIVQNALYFIVASPDYMILQ